MTTLEPDAFAGQVPWSPEAGRHRIRRRQALAQHGATVVIADIDEALAEAAAKEVNQAGGRAMVESQCEVYELSGSDGSRINLS